MDLGVVLSVLTGCASVAALMPEKDMPVGAFVLAMNVHLAATLFRIQIVENLPSPFFEGPTRRSLEAVSAALSLFASMLWTYVVVYVFPTVGLMRGVVWCADVVWTAREWKSIVSKW